MQDVLSHKSPFVVNVPNIDNAPKSPSVLDQWSTLSPAERRARIREAINAPYVDTPRKGRYEQSRVKPGKGE